MMETKLKLQTITVRQLKLIVNNPRVNCERGTRESNQRIGYDPVQNGTQNDRCKAIKKYVR